VLSGSDSNIAPLIFLLYNSYNMEYQIEKIGSGRKKIAIFGCVHGDEIIGRRVFKAIKKWSLRDCSLFLILANVKAMKKKKRWVSQDLNRSFPGKRSGNHEQKLACVLAKKMKEFDLVIDVHATNSAFDRLLIITSLNRKIKEVIKKTNVKKIALIRKKIFGGHELITHSKLGIALEYGPDKTGRNYKRAVNDLQILFKNLGVLSGKAKNYSNKDLYRVTGSYKVGNHFKPESGLKDFGLIKKGQVVGKEKKGKKIVLISTEKDFYPLFLGKGKYKGTLCLTSVKKHLDLDQAH
jgi:succinylglutamate desuccinylase